ncbi:hypothetical protein [Streptomyces sp. NBC_01022]|uniref:hypothetical protein n=1 Tax=Streptomyces sp. NBC_01022 TaxID=2903723 RepID=UPI002DDC1E17|nr:hypothetical protein [Streptomyces sp. NBC_01022]
MADGRVTAGFHDRQTCAPAAGADRPAIQPCEAAASEPASAVSGQFVARTEAVARASVAMAMDTLAVVPVHPTMRGSRSGVGSRRARAPVAASAAAASRAAPTATPARCTANS